MKVYDGICVGWRACACGRSVYIRVCCLMQIIPWAFYNWQKLALSVIHERIGGRQDGVLK